jgi:hypothetical protein
MQYGDVTAAAAGGFVCAKAFTDDEVVAEATVPAKFWAKLLADASKQINPALRLSALSNRLLSDPTTDPSIFIPLVMISNSLTSFFAGVTARQVEREGSASAYRLANRSGTQPSLRQVVEAKWSSMRWTTVCRRFLKAFPLVIVFALLADLFGWCITQSNTLKSMLGRGNVALPRLSAVTIIIAALVLMPGIMAAEVEDDSEQYPFILTSAWNALGYVGGFLGYQARDPIVTEASKKVHGIVDTVRSRMSLRSGWPDGYDDYFALPAGEFHKPYPLFGYVASPPVQLPRQDSGFNISDPADPPGRLKRHSLWAVGYVFDMVPRVSVPCQQNELVAVVNRGLLDTPKLDQEVKDYFLDLGWTKMLFNLFADMVWYEFEQWNAPDLSPC